MKKITMLMLSGLLFLATGCVSTKQLTYLQTDRNESVENAQIAHSYELKIQDDDLLYITISSKDAELVEPFKNSTMLGNTQSSSTQASGFLVDNEGYISLPLLGRIYVRGLTASAIADNIEQQLIVGNFIKDPVVTVRLGNFKITVLGEVQSPGTKLVTGNRITILEAISMGGDMTPIGKRKSVKILREANGKQTLHEIDLTSADILSSPYYYLCQNDVIYVEPNKSLSVKSSPWTTYLGVGGSVLSLIISIITLATVSK